MINPAGRESRGVGVGLDRSNEISDPRDQSVSDDGDRHGAIDNEFDPPPADLFQSPEEGDGSGSLPPVQRSATPLPGEAGVDHVPLPFANYGGGDGDGESDGEFIFQPFFRAPELATVGEHWRNTLSRQLPPTIATPTTASPTTAAPTISTPTLAPHTTTAPTAAPRLGQSQLTASQPSTLLPSTSQAGALQPGISQLATTQTTTPQTFTREATTPPSSPVSRTTAEPSGAQNVVSATQPTATSHSPAISQSPAASGTSLNSAGAQFSTDSPTSSLLSPAAASSRLADAATGGTTNTDHSVLRGNAPQTSTSPLTAYLLGGGDAGTDLSPETRIALSLLGEVLGEDGINVLASHIKAGDSAHSRLLEAALNYVLRDVGRESAAAPMRTVTIITSAYLAHTHLALTHLAPAHIAPGHIAPGRIAPALTASTLDAPAPVAPHVLTERTNFPRVVSELVAAVRLGAHFDNLEKFGGAIVRQAENSLRGFLTRGRGEARAGVALTELVRDLRSGAFLSMTGTLAQFPLTGRARVASEMIALMRTLDVIERALSRAADSQPMTAPVLSPRLERPSGRDARAALVPDSPGLYTVAPRLPRLPGRAGRFEIDNFVRTLFGGRAAAWGGTPPDLPTLPGLPTLPDLPTLRAGDGTPLKPRELLWLGAAGGLLTNSDGEANSATLSPALAQGFDALYSLIGFDGRSPLAPAFLLVQSEINDAKPDAMLGQAPFTVGWTRALIERLKDSAVAAHNRLGEQLEVALADDCLHSFVLRGAIEDGAPVAGSFALSAVATPAASIALAPRFCLSELSR